MRHHIEHLSSSAMEWEKLAPGVYRKMLNHNQDSGERTAMFRFEPDEGANPPNICHYHSVSEEILVLDGRMTFDHKVWLSTNGYVFHPPFAVHGFNSAVPEPTTFIGKSPRELDFNYPEESDASEPFFVDGHSSNRAVTYLNPTDEDGWEVVRDPQGAAIGRRLNLSEDEETGEGANLIRFNAGLEVPARSTGYATVNEGFVLEGRVVAEEGTVWEKGDYWHRHPGKPVPALKIEQSALIYSCTGPRGEA